MPPPLYPLGHKLKESYSLSAAETLILARQLGVELVLAGAGLRAIGPRTAITELAPHIPACKAELLRLLIESGDAVLVGAINSSRLTTRLMAAAMRRCDHFNDSEAAREAMRLDVLKTPLRLQQELLDYFNSVN